MELDKRDQLEFQGAKTQFQMRKVFESANLTLSLLMPAMKKNRKHVVAWNNCQVVQENIFKMGVTKDAEYFFGSCTITPAL
jgi:hypothetical protein